MAGEQKLQSRIINDLEKKGWIVIKNIMLSKNGFPDISASKMGEAIYIEVKDKGETPSPLQEYRIEKYTEHLFFSTWCDTFDSYKNWYMKVEPDINNLINSRIKYFKLKSQLNL